MNLLKKLQNRLESASNKELELNKKLNDAFLSIEQEKHKQYNTPNQDPKIANLLEEKITLEKLREAGKYLKH